MNMFGYVKKHSKYSFRAKPFNEVDNVIFSLVPYLPLNDVVSNSYRPKTLEQVINLFNKKINKKQIVLTARLYKKIHKLLDLMKDTPRYRDVLLYNYIKIVDYDKQFCAVTLKLPDNSIYISYEGTDCSIGGWYEDACMTYKFPVPAQELASNYLKHTLKFWNNNVRIGGHSKGGNLAAYAALEAPFYLRSKIIKVYNNDGPGFFKEQFDTKKYRKILPKIQKIVPRESVVGMFLYQSEDITIVKSRSKRIFQHDPFNWQIEDVSFAIDTLSDFSRGVSEKTNNWLANLPLDKREQCMEDLFEVFSASEIEEMYQLFSLDKMKKFLKNLYHINDESKENLIAVFKDIIW